MPEPLPATSSRTRGAAGPRARRRGTAGATASGFVVGTAGALGHGVVLPAPSVPGPGPGTLPVGLVLAILLAGSAMLAAVASAVELGPRAGLAVGWLAAVGLAGWPGPGNDLLLRDDTRSLVFLGCSATVMGAVALLVPGWLR